MGKLSYIFIFGAIMGLVLSVFFSDFAFAQLQLPNPLKTDNITGLISNITSFIFTLALVLAPLMLIVAGLLFVISAGDPDKIKRAKSLVTYTIVGLVIVFLARGFVALIESVLRG